MVLRKAYLQRIRPFFGTDVLKRKRERGSSVRQAAKWLRKKVEYDNGALRNVEEK